MRRPPTQRGRREPSRGTSRGSCSRARRSVSRAPTSNTAVATRREQLAAALETLCRRPGPRLIAGDFNLTEKDVEPLLAARGSRPRRRGRPRPRTRPGAASTGSRWTPGSRCSAAGCTGRSWATTARSSPTSRCGPRRRPARSRRSQATRPGPIVCGVPYATRPMHDADSHIMEEPDWLHPYLDRATRDRFPYVWSVGDEPGRWGIDKERARHADTEYRAEDESQLMLRKNFSATGSFLNVDRPQALDLLGFSSQLVFDTFTSSPILRFDRDGEYELAVTLARAQHRAILDWCSVDARLLACHRRTRRRHGRGGDAHARSDRRRDGRDPDRSVLHARPLAESHRARSDVVDVRRSRRARAVARRGRGRTRDAAGVLRERPAAGSGLPRR